MIRRLAKVAALTLVCMIAASPAFARHHQKIHHQQSYSAGCPLHLGCGCNLAVKLGLGPRRDLWYARNFEHEGSAASRGCIGCVAVLSRGRHHGHVGIVRSYDPNGNPVIESYANARLGWTVMKYPSGRVLAYRSI